MGKKLYKKEKMVYDNIRKYVPNKERGIDNLMSWMIELITNPFLITGISSWFYAQVLKTIIYLIINKKLDMTRMFGDGGMPSGHSATVTSIAFLIGLVYGPGSVEFAISFILAIIVCHDATGVRRETEKQAYLINELVKAFEELAEEKLPEVKLKKFVGHTPIQVMAGITLGIANAVVMYFVLF